MAAALVLYGAAVLLVGFFSARDASRSQDAFLVGALMWLMVSVPALFTSRYVDESQRQLLAGRILGWLAKTAIAATAAAYFITFP